MPNPNAIVDTVSRLDTTTNFITSGPGAIAHPAVTVHFSSGQSARLPTSPARSSAYARILDDMWRVKAPVYVEVNPATNSIDRLLLPLTVVVTGLDKNEDGDVDVTLEISHSRHVLRASNPDFDELLETLRASLERGTQVLVTETDVEHEIIDVRQATPPFVLERVRASSLLLSAINFDLPLTQRAVTPLRAAQLFDSASARTCRPVAALPPCIPFSYPDDGCWGRAHAMCRRMIGVGELPGKVWVYGDLRVRTRNHPGCELPWGWHVAPTLQVTDAGGTTTPHVVDPSLFDELVPEEVWLAELEELSQIDATVHTDAVVFYRAPDGRVEFDPLGNRTDLVLIQQRGNLMRRSAEPAGPPPFAHCTL